MIKSASKIFVSSTLIALTLFISGCDGKKAAKEEIEQKGITYNIDSFADAIASKNTDVINLFIKAGIDASSSKVLKAVLNSEDKNLLKKLIDDGLNPNVKITFKEGEIAPLLTVTVIRPEILKELLKKDNIDINAQDSEGSTALMNAMRYGLPESVSLLVEAGADVSMSNYKGEDAHTLAMLSQVGDKTKVLLLKALGEKLNPNARFNQITGNVSSDESTDFPLLFLSVINEWNETTNFLLKKGADINAKGTFRTTYAPMTLLQMFTMKSSSEKEEKIANMLLDKGADKTGALEAGINNGASLKLLKRLGATNQDLTQAAIIALNAKSASY